MKLSKGNEGSIWVQPNKGQNLPCFVWLQKMVSSDFIFPSSRPYTGVNAQFYWNLLCCIQLIFLRGLLYSAGKWKRSVRQLGGVEEGKLCLGSLCERRIHFQNQPSAVCTSTQTPGQHQHRAVVHINKFVFTSIYSQESHR